MNSKQYPHRRNRNLKKEGCGSPEKYMNNIDRQREKQGHFKGNTTAKSLLVTSMIKAKSLIPYEERVGKI